MEYPTSVRLAAEDSARLLPKPLAPGSQNWHQIPVSSGVPAFFSSARGARVIDVDGSELIDLYCGSGTVILGHGDPYQVAAVRRILDTGATVSFRHPLELELARYLAELCDGADYAAFFKTGSEAVYAAVTTAIRATGRTAVLTTGYHGWLLSLGEIEGGNGVAVVPLRWTSPTLLEDAARSVGSAACLIVSPTPEMPNRQTVVRLVDASRAAGALIVFDEVKAGFRWAYPTVSSTLGILPDLLVLSKAIGNGFPIAALLGRDDLLGSPQMFSAFSTYASETVSIAASLACLHRLADGAYEQFAQSSESMYTALAQACGPYGITLRGVPTFFRLDLPDWVMPNELCSALFHRGVLYHPEDQVLLTAAHGSEEIDHVCASFEASLDEVAG